MRKIDLVNVMQQSLETVQAERAQADKDGVIHKGSEATNFFAYCAILLGDELIYALKLVATMEEAPPETVNGARLEIMNSLNQELNLSDEDKKPVQVH